jgi:hypothetical protein
VIVDYLLERGGGGGYSTRIAGRRNDGQRPVRRRRVTPSLKHVPALQSGNCLPTRTLSVPTRTDQRRIQSLRVKFEFYSAAAAALTAEGACSAGLASCSWNRTTEIHSAQIVSRRKPVLRLGSWVAQAWAQPVLTFVRPLLCTGRMGTLWGGEGLCERCRGATNVPVASATVTRPFSLCSPSPLLINIELSQLECRREQARSRGGVRAIPSNSRACVIWQAVKL